MKLTRLGTGVVLLVWLLASVLLWLGLEAWALSDAIPANHITAVVRAAFFAEPGVFVWLAFSFGFLAGHLLWGGRE